MKVENKLQTPIYSSFDSESELESESVGKTLSPPALLFASPDNGSDDDEGPNPAKIYQYLKIDTILYKSEKGDEQFDNIIQSHTLVSFSANDYESDRRKVCVYEEDDLQIVSRIGYIIPVTNEGISTDDPTVNAEIATSGWGEKTLLQQDTQLYSKADTESSSEPINRNTHVQILNKPNENEQGWAEVNVTGTKKKGFVRKTALLYKAKDIPEGSKLHNVAGPEQDEAGNVTKNGDTLEGIMQQYYPERQQYDVDPRTIANVILAFNNPENRQTGEAIYVEDASSLLGQYLVEHGANYDMIKILANHDILVPSWDYVLAHLGDVKSGSTTEAALSFWPDGFGAHLEASVMAGFLFFEGAVGSTVYFYRKGSNIVVNVQAFALAGVAAGIGAGIHIGKTSGGNKSGKGIGVFAGAEASAHQQALGKVEFVIPMRSGVMLKFIDGVVKSAVTLDGDAMAKTFLEGFDGDPFHFINSFEVGLGVKAQAEASAYASITSPGKNAKTQNHGGFETSTTSTTNSSRNTHDENINNPKREGLISSITDLIAKGDAKKLGQRGIWELSRLIRELTMLSGSAKVAAAGGVEYHKVGGRDQFSVFIEGSIALSLKLPFLPNMAIDGNAGLRFVFLNVGTPQNKAFEFKGLELAIGSGDMDDPNMEASEFSVGLNEAQGDTFFEVVENSLATLKIQKRIALNYTSFGLGATLRRVSHIKALMDSDYKSFGVELNATLTIGLDLSLLNTKDGSFRQNIDDFKAFLGWDEKEKNVGFVTDKIRQSISALHDGTAIADGAEAFLDLIIQPKVLTDFAVHVELGAGMAAGAKAKLAVELQLDGSIGIGLVYHRDFSKEIVGVLGGSEAGAQIRTAILNGSEAISNILNSVNLEGA